MKMLLLAASAALLGAADTMPTPYFIDMSTVERIDCATNMGTGVRIDGDTVLTAYHVVSRSPCTIDGVSVTIAHSDAKLDVAVLTLAGQDHIRAAISCDGPKRGARYYAVGYALGEGPAIQRMLGTETRRRRDDPVFGGLSVFKGNSYSGMSGGPIIDEDGQVVAIVNAGPRNGQSYMLGRSLSDTYLCDA